jgi:Mrp family chromosome partitioning ATPase
MSITRLALQQRYFRGGRGPARSRKLSIDGALRNAIKWRKGSILVWMIGSAGFAAAALATLTPSYTATAEIMPPLASLSPSEDGPSNPTYLSAFAEALRSDAVISAVADDMRLWNVPEFSTPTYNRLAHIIDGEAANSIASEDRRTRTLASLKDALSISSVDDKHTLQITFRSHDPQLAATVANAFAHTSVRYFAQKQDQGEESAIRNLEQRLGTVTTEVKEAEAARKNSGNPSHGATTDGQKQTQSKLETYQALHATLLREYAEAVQPKPAVLGAPQVIANATPYAASRGANSALTLLLATCFGGIAGLAFGIRREFFDLPIRSSRSIEQNLGFHCFGGIADVSGRRLVPRTRPLPPLALHDDQDVLRKALARIRENVPEASSCIVGVSSAEAGEGKSTIAFNMAIVASEEQRRVLLIDADLHQPRLMHELGLTSSLSLRDILRNPEALPVPASKSAFGFDFVGEREPEPMRHPASVLGSTAMTALLAKARDHYDIIICDLPDLSNHADPVIFASSLDAVVLVASFGTSASVLGREIRQSRSILERVAGVFINKVPAGAKESA